MKASVRVRTIGLFLVLGAGISPAWAVGAPAVYKIDPSRSNLHGSIHYTVLGKYEAQFQEFGGTISFDPKDLPNSSVQLSIKVASLKSRFARLDRAVISKRLLDARQYPWITFTGRSITRVGDHFQITGEVSLHGIKRELTFPFQLQGPWKDQKGNALLTAQGTWIIRRKDFQVIWNKLLDQGGVIVGDHVTVDWKVTAVRRADPGSDR